MWICIPVAAMNAVAMLITAVLILESKTPDEARMFAALSLYFALMGCICVAAIKTDGTRLMYEQALEGKGILIRFTDVNGSQVLRWSEISAEKGDVK